MPSDPNGYPSFNRPLVTDTHLVLFSGSTLTTYPLTTKALAAAPTQTTPLLPFHSYPLAVSSSKFLMSDSLYLAPQRVYLGLLQGIKDETYPLYASILYMLHVHEPALAAHLISHLVQEPRTRALYTVALGLKQL